MRILRPVVAVALTLLAACQKGGTMRYVITGSSTCQPVIQEVVTRLEQQDPSIRYQVEAGGSGRGITDARTKKANAGMASRDLKADETAGIEVVPFARDGVTMIVHSDRDLAGLTSDQVRAIFTGGLSNWRELGGPDQAIHVLNKAEGRATLEVFLQRFQLKNSDIKANAIVGDNAQCLRLVAGNPLAIGYLSIGDALRAVANKEPVRLLSLDGIVPSLQTVQDGTFSLGRSLFLLFPAAVDAPGQHILDYLRSPAGSELLLSYSFVPLSGN